MVSGCRLRPITTKAVVKALSQFISIFGIPEVVQSGRGSIFSSNMFGQVLKLLRIRQSQSSAYHAQSQGALERFHQSLRSLLCEGGDTGAQMSWSLDILCVVPWQY